MWNQKEGRKGESKAASEGGGRRGRGIKRVSEKEWNQRGGRKKEIWQERKNGERLKETEEEGRKQMKIKTEEIRTGTRKQRI